MNEWKMDEFPGFQAYPSVYVVAIKWLENE